MIRKGCLAVLAGAVLLSGCEAPEPETGAVTGTLQYRERIALGPEAVAKITLEDVSRADAPAVVIAEQELVNPGQPPIAYRLEYPLAAIDQRMTYSVRARIVEGDQLLFTSDTHAPVLTRGADSTADLLLVRAQTAPVARPAPDRKRAGMFRYMADAAMFRDCQSNKSFPVAMEGAYIELERAYLDSGIEAGKELKAEIEGRFLKRPSMEGFRSEVSLIVDEFIAVYPGETCTSMSNETLLNTYWKLVALGDRPVSTPQGQREAHMILGVKEGEARVHGNAGCNNFFGGYAHAGEALSFGRLGATMMACAEGMDTERDFLAALEAADRHEIAGQVMTLFAGDNAVARFEAVHLP